MAKILLWLFVINLGVAFGAGLYESRIEVPAWFHETSEGVEWNPEAASAANTGLRFWVYVTTVPLTLLTLLNLFFASRERGALRRWWLVAGACALAERAFTLAYFIPTMVGLLDSPPSPESTAAASRWVSLNFLRHAISLAAWILALRAFAVLHSRAGETTR